MAAQYRVYVVVDKEYGEGVCELARTGPVWIIDTPVNRAAARKIWAERPHASNLGGVTTFISQASSPEDILVDELDMVDLHHGSYSADPPYTVLEVVGASATESVRAEMGQYGFNEFYSTTAGFRAVRPIPCADIGDSEL